MYPAIVGTIVTSSTQHPMAETLCLTTTVRGIAGRPHSAERRPATLEHLAFAVSSTGDSASPLTESAEESSRSGGLAAFGQQALV